ncbi:MAG: sulfotransferase family 2 domain-containing protein [Actinomycetes bacterium]
MTTAFDPFVDHSIRTSVFFPVSRLFVSGNPKAAGTSLRWWLLQSHGIDVAKRTEGSLWGESAPAQTVWDGSVNLRFTWDSLSDAERDDALSSVDVLSVLAVRHPVTRAFSSWAGKYLTLEPYYNERLGDEFPLPPDQIDSREQIRDLFEEFVLTVAARTMDADRWVGFDVHFWPQHLLLARTPVGPTLQLRQESMGEGLAAIDAHLLAHGITPAAVPRFNENVIPYQPDLVSESALTALVELYGPDFDAYDYDPTAPSATDRVVDLDWLNDVRGRNRRYEVVHRAAIDGRQRTRAMQRRIDELDSELAALRASRSWQVTQPLRWASEHVGAARPVKPPGTS